jgi:anti-sigma factor RsiW
MSEPTPHLGDELHELLDGRLDPARAAIVSAHLDACDACRHEWQRLRWLKTRLRALAETPAVPDDLDLAIRAALDRDHPARPSTIVRWTVAAGVAALLALAIAGGLWWWLRAPTPVEVAADYHAVTTGTLGLEQATADPRALERHFAARGGVPARVYDLGMMRYRLVGGRVHAHRGQPGTIAVYEGANGERVICEMYYAPPPSRAPVERRTHNGIDFLVYRDGDLIMVFWDEGPVTCVLTATMDAEALIQLAFAKAVRQS